MLDSLDHIVLAVADLEAATEVYAALLGRAPSWRGAHPALGTRNTLFRLANTYLELLAADGDATGPLGGRLRQVLGTRQERPFALALGVARLDTAVDLARARGLRLSDAADGAGSDDTSGVRRTWRSAIMDDSSVRGLRLFLIEHTSPAALLPPAPATGADGAIADGVDHVVVFSQDLDASRTLWTTSLGLREEWRHDFPERGTRNLGLDLGGIVVELITRIDRSPDDKPDTFWGVAYRVGDCDLAIARLRHAGIEVDEPRPGLAADTRVATVRWQRTPTLLIER